MRVGDFSVKVGGGVEHADGYVDMRHAQVFTLELISHTDRRCDALVEIDGKEVGNFRVEPYSTFTVERPVNEDGCFTFFEASSSEARTAGGRKVTPSKAGLIKVTFTPEIPRPQVWNLGRLAPRGGDFSAYLDHRLKSSPRGDAQLFCSANACRGSDFAPGVTGLSGQSDQEYYSADRISHDLGKITEINLRMRCVVAKRRARRVRELRPVAVFSNSTPPPVKQW